MFKQILSSILLIGLISPALSQTPPVDKKANLPSPNATPVINTPNVVTGLILPPDKTVQSDEGFITIKADCAGTVKWLVLSALKIKYFPLPDNEILVSIPCQTGTINLFAVGTINGVTTDFARINITINAPTPPAPIPNPVTSGPYHVNFIFDINTVTPELAAVLNSQKIIETVVSKNSFYRRFDMQNAANRQTLSQTGLDVKIKEAGGPPLIIIQNNSGALVTAPIKIPKTEADVLQILNSILK